MPSETLAAICHDAYAGFGHPAVVPLVQLETSLFVQELFHGPTLAFKDMALQVVGRLFDHVLTARGEQVTIVGATSGDTGSAAIEACLGRERISVVFLHPHGRVSEVQRRQMTTVHAPNVGNIAIEGTFDDCQDLVKAMFADAPFRAEMHLSAMNSINWARIAAQVPYYVAAALALGAPDREVAFSVPTGNFGNMLAAWVARRMGLPVARLIVGSNRNDILARFLAANDMSMAPVERALSPSMDIQVSSNFERLLFELLDRDPAATAAAMQAFRETGRMAVPEMAWHRARAVFHGFRLDDAGTEAEIRRLYEATRLSGRSAHRGRHCRRARPAAGAGGDHGGGGDGASGEISRCDRAGGGLAPAAAAAAGRSVRPGGAVPGAAERTRRGRGRGAGADPAQHGRKRGLRHAKGRAPSPVEGAARANEAIASGAGRRLSGCRHRAPAAHGISGC